MNSSGITEKTSSLTDGVMDVQPKEQTNSYDIKGEVADSTATTDEEDDPSVRNTKTETIGELLTRYIGELHDFANAVSIAVQQEKCLVECNFRTNGKASPHRLAKGHPFFDIEFCSRMRYYLCRIDRCAEDMSHRPEFHVQ
jgi:hypothetical protein